MEAHARSSSPRSPAPRCGPAPKPTEVGLDHLHGGTVRVKDEAEILAAAAAGSPAHLPGLIADAESTLVVVARFLALLEMYRDAVAFDQLSAAGGADGPLDRRRQPGGPPTS